MTPNTWIEYIRRYQTTTSCEIVRISLYLCPVMPYAPWQVRHYPRYEVARQQETDVAVFGRTLHGPEHKTYWLQYRNRFTIAPKLTFLYPIHEPIGLWLLSNTTTNFLSSRIC